MAIPTEIKHEVVKKFGIISQSSKGWKKEVNLIKWNDLAPKLDIRDWSPDNSKMGKGVTLSSDEVKKLKELLTTIDF
ncbi:MAG: hypothetical protein LBV16_09075 [Elusimicrobiota bacterium]|jgi:hypothetical protein|nr:hypothetical protein [Elusimicrobiota bacterium]